MASLKFHYNNEYRRINLISYLPNQRPVPYYSITKLITVQFLLDKIAAVFSPTLNEKKIMLSWKDQDGDSIKFSTDEELQDALFNQYKATGTENCTFKFDIEIFVDPIESIPVGAAAFGGASMSNDTELPETPVHIGVTCDECQLNPIRGTRYKCAVRRNFDLCQNCERKVTQPFPMVKIYHPDQAPAAIYIALNEESENNMNQGGCRFGGRFRGRHHGEGGPFSQRHGGHHFGGRKFWKQFMKAAGCPFPTDCDEPVETTAHYSTQNSNEPQPPFSGGTTASANATNAPTQSANTEPKDDAVSKKPKARFVHDVTFPDGTTVPPGTVYLKVWRVRNDGTVAWPDGSTIVPAGGDLFTAVDFSDLLPSAPVGEEVDIAVQLTAPLDTGRHVAYFRLQTREGTNFGHRLWSDIRVSTEEEIDAASTTGWQVVSGILNQENSTPEVQEAEPVHEEVQEEVPVVAPSAPELQIPVTTEEVVEPYRPNGRNPFIAEEVEDIPLPHEEEVVETVIGAPSPYAAELKLLADMGFVEHGQILPLLSRYVPHPNGQPNPEAMQAIVMQLLSSSNNFNFA